jgi:hypothetical protein
MKYTRLSLLVISQFIILVPLYFFANKMFIGDSMYIIPFIVLIIE